MPLETHKDPEPYDSRFAGGADSIVFPLGRWRVCALLQYTILLATYVYLPRSVYFYSIDVTFLVISCSCPSDPNTSHSQLFYGTNAAF